MVPSYAINLETGDRLNIAFGEDSYQVNNNGDDMMWNPNDVVSEQTYRFAFGGRHYIYVFGNNRSGTTYSGGLSPAAIKDKLIGSGTYASSFHDLAFTYKWAFQTSVGTGSAIVKNSANVALTNFWTDAMWVNIPVTVDSRYNFKNPADMPCDARVSLRVKKAYRPAYSGNTFVDSSSYTSSGFVSSILVLANRGTPNIMPFFGANSNVANAVLKLSKRYGFCAC